jgi:hypothetical protein
MRQLINHIIEDVEVLERCFENRLVDLANSPLATADKLAWAALKPAKKLGLIAEETTVLTYFGKIASIRTIPYASVALICVPRTLPGVTRDYLAIPHEIGHYVYWNPPSADRPGDSIQSRLSRLMADRRQRLWVRNWQEEIFADVYGALVARATITQSFQDMLFETSDEQLCADDGEHPTPVIRPEVYSYLLKRINYALAEAMRLQWQQSVKARSAVLPMTRDNEDVAFLVVQAQSDAAPVLVIDDVRSVMNDVIDDVFNMLDAGQFNVDAQSFPREPDDFNQTGEALYRYFETQVANFVSAVPMDVLDAASVIGRPWKTWCEAYGMPALEALTGLDDPIKSDRWFEFFRLSGGWTTDGPQSRPGENP